MNDPAFRRGGLLAAAAPATSLLGAMAQAAPRTWKVPRTAEGHPDLQGTWTNATITPLERPERYGGRLVLTAAEAHELEQAEAQFNETANAPTDPATRASEASAPRRLRRQQEARNRFRARPQAVVRSRFW